VQSAPQQDLSTSRNPGRHRARRKPHRTIKIIGLAVPALAVAGGLVASQAQSQQLNPIASSLAAYHLRPVSPAVALVEATSSARASIAQLARSAKASTKARRKPAAAADRAHSGHAAKPAASATGKTAPAAAALTCSGTGGTGMLPYNYATIVSFLAAHGYTDLAAAGIAGNMYQESDGNPESVGSGGGGLIGWTPLPSGFVTGNVAADLQTQLEAVLTFNDGWSQYIPMLNAATSATDAAYIYMTYFERPGLPAAANREGAAAAVAQACGIS
jgi:hypothetical protein